MKKLTLSAITFLLLHAVAFAQVMQLSFAPAQGLYSVHCINYDTVVVTGENGYIIRTTNSGNTWSTVTSNTSNALYKVKFVTKTIGYAVGAKGTVLKTTDCGQSWAGIGIKTDMSLLSMSFINKDTGWVAGGSALSISFLQGNKGILMKTINGGNTWQIDSSYSATISSVFFLNSSLGFICTNDNKSPKSFQFVKKTINGGNSFTVVKKDSMNSYYTDVQFINSKTGYFACYAGGMPGGVFKTTDYANTWNHVPLSSGTIRNLFVLDTCIYYSSIADLPGAGFSETNSCLNTGFWPIPQWLSPSILSKDSGFAVTFFSNINNNSYGNHIYKWHSKFVGVPEKSLPDTYISIFPNPTTGKVNVQVSQFEDSKTNNLEVYNLFGECIHHQTGTSKNQQLDLSSQPQGIYIIKVNSADETFMKKITIQR
jgi:photosystem II stability/assembly factor-like uncharacterized protein